MARTVILATIVAGTLDILFAVFLTLAFGGQPLKMLRYVASGPVPAATEWGVAGSFLGLLVHFALMAIMATAFVWIAGMRPAILARPVVVGIVYGLLTYVVMNWIVVPIRFDKPLPPTLLSMATQLFAHIVLVGLPFALIAKRQLPLEVTSTAG